MCAMRNIHIVPYNPDWQPQYESEAARLRSVFGDLLVAIHHIGSTSVPGLHAKPLIDIMPIVRDIERVEDYNEVMVALGYTTRGENGISGRRYFTKGKDDQRSHHVHIYAADNPEVTAHLQFRDYLRAHPAEAQRYGDLKQKLALQFTNDIYGYMDGKDALVKELIAKANIWHHNR
jgi:GrpB-like predicted nucleotidyltransferase (UPF0157 family)